MLPNALLRSSTRRSTTLRHRVAQHTRGDRVALGVIGIEKAFRRYPLEYLGQLPSQIHRILHTDVEALSTHRGMHMRGVAGQQDASVAVSGGLPRHVGEAGDPGGTVNTKVGAVDGDQRLADVAQCGFAGGSDVPLGQYDPRSSILRLADAMLAEGVLVKSPFRLLGCFKFGDQPARRRIPAGEFDAGYLADEAAAAIAARRDTAPAATDRRRARRRRRCRPA